MLKADGWARSFKLEDKFRTHNSQTIGFRSTVTSFSPSVPQLEKVKSKRLVHEEEPDLCPLLKLWHGMPPLLLQGIFEQRKARLFVLPSSFKRQGKPKPYSYS